MIDEDAEHSFEMRPVEDEEPVEAFRAGGADEAFGDRVRRRRSDGRADNLDALASEDRESKSRVNLLSRSRIRNPAGVDR